MSLNKWQEDNLQVMDALEKDLGKRAVEMTGGDLVGHFSCVKCGHFPVSSRAVEFYNNQVTLVECYECQEISRSK